MTVESSTMLSFLLRRTSSARTTAIPTQPAKAQTKPDVDSQCSSRVSIATKWESMASPERKAVNILLSGVTIMRDGSHVIKPDQNIGLNIHRGGINGTSSEGCQTVLREQWEEFFEDVKRELKQWRQSEIQYVLIEKQG